MNKTSLIKEYYRTNVTLRLQKTNTHYERNNSINLESKRKHAQKLISIIKSKI